MIPCEREWPTDQFRVCGIRVKYVNSLDRLLSARFVAAIMKSADLKNERATSSYPSLLLWVHLL